MSNTPTLQAYHPTLSAAIDALRKHLDEREIVLANGFDDFIFPYMFDGIPYETHKEIHAEIATVKGKPTVRFAHACIWRMNTGTYEINFYML